MRFENSRAAAYVHALRRLEVVLGREGKGFALGYLLSDHIGIMAGVDLEAAVVGPEVD